jgi:hypothetical protein
MKNIQQMILFRACKRQNVKKISPFEWRQAQSDTAVGNKNGGLNQ